MKYIDVDGDLPDPSKCADVAQAPAQPGAGSDLAAAWLRQRFTEMCVCESVCDVFCLAVRASHPAAAWAMARVIHNKVAAQVREELVEEELV